MIDESELKHRTNEADITFQTDGWKYIEAEWFVEREKIISLGKKAVEEGRTEQAAYLMAELTGFDRALKVPQVFKIRFEEFLSAEKERKEPERENH